MGVWDLKDVGEEITYIARLLEKLKDVPIKDVSIEDKMYWRL